MSPVAESFLQLSDFEYSEFLTSFSQLLENLCVPDLFLREHFKTRFLKLFQCLDVTQVNAELSMIQETGESTVKIY